MATLWGNLLRRRRAAEARGPGNTGPIDTVPATERRYLAIVARDRPDLVSRVNRLFLVEGKVEAIVDRRRAERRRRAEPSARERRRSDRRVGSVEGELSTQNVIIARASLHGSPERLAQWAAEGRELLFALRRSLDEMDALAREVDELRTEAGRLRDENQALRERHAEMTGILQNIARPLGEIVQRLRVA